MQKNIRSIWVQEGLPRWLAAKGDRAIPSQRVLSMLRSRHFVMLLALFGICTLCYYFGQIVDFAGWAALRWEFWYTVHDFHRLLFLGPISWAGYFFGIRAAATVTIAALIVFLPRAIFISPFPLATARAVLDGVAIGAAGYIIAMVRNGSKPLIAVVRSETDEVVGIPKKIEDGVVTAADLEVDLSRRLTRRRGQIVKLTKTEYDLLSCLVRNNGKAVRREDLLRNV